MSNTVGNVAIWVSDLERSERFYVDMLGLEVTARVETPDVREIILGPLLLACGDGTPNPAGVWKVYIEVDDPPALHQRLVDAGVESVMAPTHLARFDITIAMVRDPDGYLLELAQRGS